MFHNSNKYVHHEERSIWNEKNKSESRKEY